MSSEEKVSQLVDSEALSTRLTAELGPAETYEIERFPGGHSNETLFVAWNGHDLVLRRPPPGETAKNAHDVLREYHVMDALGGTDVRVPSTVLACADHSVIGSEFYIMESIKGPVLRNDEIERFSSADARRAIAEELIDRLVEIHSVDVEAVGLTDFGRPDGFLTRQVSRWREQFDWAREITAEEREIPSLKPVREWLDQNIPESSPSTLVHGDYKLDNVIFEPNGSPEIAAIVDWEMSTLGDPLTDLSWLLTYWQDADDDDCAIPELIPTFTRQEGYPTKAALVNRYEQATGTTFEHDRFYRALAIYKLAGICEMFYRRYLKGNSDNPMYPKMRQRVPTMVDWALRIIEGEDPL
ncbi:phosphotransferase family protein [Haloglomus irregulare]|jgi:aminoglycoside phosphotransferase (APT) family kinase protein|uniref:Phosphotransferase family protein n=1 Tax=Haloglomus irregulare TaxID=2234134 RepID=A0A554MVT2_9EURY|nr:phosphotransferase family protein [Haloglomus irregulare]TSD08910.1 phosphotransferase family protein [Haloglomus irregulare]